jgi:hypothetical protein
MGAITSGSQRPLHFESFHLQRPLTFQNDKFLYLYYSVFRH